MGFPAPHIGIIDAYFRSKGWRSAGRWNGTATHAGLGRRKVAEGWKAVVEKVTPRLARLPLDLVRYKMFVTSAPVSEADLTEILDDIVIPLIAQGRAS
jgi:hypothetical protein